jgi:hypothetical protein
LSSQTTAFANTRFGMKKQLLRSLILFAFAGTAIVVHAQRSARWPADVKHFVASAKDADQEMALLLPAVQKVHEAAAFVPIIQTARKLATEVQRAGNSMPQPRYEAFQRDLAAIETSLDNILNPKTPAGKKPLNDCPKSCHNGFGDGFGDGKDWSRFVCKLGCFKIGSR